MDQESIVYGCIKYALGINAEIERRNANRNAMLALPTAEELSFLSREMFALPELGFTNESYHTDVMHFGASYQAIEYEWNAWIKKFEELLDKMYWTSAVVHLETELTGTHTFVWESKNNGHIPGEGIANVHCQWTQEHSLM